MRAFFGKALFVGLVLALLAGMRLAAQGNPEAAKVRNPVASTPESVAAGKRAFQRFRRGATPRHFPPAAFFVASRSRKRLTRFDSYSQPSPPRFRRESRALLRWGTCLVILLVLLVVAAAFAW